MSRIFYIADTHFGHANVIKFDNRPFGSVEEMNEQMIRRWNDKVHRDDHVYIVGDFAFANAVKTMDYAGRLHGFKHLVFGNHDKRSENYTKCFRSADDVLKIKDMVYGRPARVLLCHYWIPFAAGQRSGLFMLHGHTHKTKESVIEEELKQEIIARQAREIMF